MHSSHNKNNNDELQVQCNAMHTENILLNFFHMPTKINIVNYVSHNTYKQFIKPVNIYIYIFISKM